jgi:hypothetical protein
MHRDFHWRFSPSLRSAGTVAHVADDMQAIESKQQDGIYRQNIADRTEGDVIT